MRHVRVRITADGREQEIHPMWDVMANAPAVERATAMQWNFTEAATAMFHFVVGDADAFEAAVADVPEVLGYDVEPTGEAAFYAYVRAATTGPLRDLLEPISVGGLVVVPPIVYHADGTVTLSMFGPDETLQTAVEGVPDPVRATVEEVGGLRAAPVAVETRLSDRQRAAVKAGLELGYYEVPREATHEDVAGALDCAPSTAAEHLRKAETKLVRAAFQWH